MDTRYILSEGDELGTTNHEKLNTMSPLFSSKRRVQNAMAEKNKF